MAQQLRRWLPFGYTPLDKPTRNASDLYSIGEELVNPPTNRRKIWKAAASRYATPSLPGEWLVLNRELILRPFDFIARGVGALDYTLVAILEPLYMPLDYLQTGWSAAVGCDIRGVFPYHTLKFGDSPAEKYMLDLVKAVTDTALPYVIKNGSLEGYFGWCQRRSLGHPNGVGDPHILYRQAATAIILQRPEDAKNALDGVRQGINWDPTDDRQWVRDLYEQAGALRDRLVADPKVVRENLISGIGEQKRRRKLPTTG